MNAGYKATEKFFKQIGWKYEIVENVFRCEVELNSKTKYAVINIDTEDKCVVVFVSLNYKIKKSMFADILKMLNLLNMSNPASSLFLDMEEQMIMCRFGHFYLDGNVDSNMVGAQVGFSIDIIEKLGNILPDLEKKKFSVEQAVALMMMDKAEM